MHGSATEPARAGATAPAAMPTTVPDATSARAPASASDTRSAADGERLRDRRGPLEDEHDFRSAATAGVGLTAAVLLLPWAVLNLVAGDLLIGLVASAVVAVVATVTIAMRREGGARLRTRPIVLGTMVAVIGALGYTVWTLGTIGLFWCYPAALAFYGLLEERHARAANALLLGTALPIAFVAMDTPLALRAAATLACTSLFGAILVRTIERQREALLRRAETDPLTGLANRHGLHGALESGLVEATGDRGPGAALMIVDLDHFKRVNDAHGHGAGDGVLRAAGALLMASVRSGERAFRLGGEEFLLLVRAGSDEALTARAETLRRAIEGARMPGLPPVTASIGTAAGRAGEPPGEWLARADAALYRAKAGGRNRVEGG